MYSNQFQDFSQKAIKAENTESLQTLERAIKFSGNEFSLIFVICNYTKLRNQMMQKLRKDIDKSLNIKEIIIPKYTESLYEAIQEEFKDKQPSTLMLFGLESVSDIDQVLKSAKQDREELKEKFSFLVVLWLTDKVLSRMLRLAPDFASPALVPIEFDITTEELINSINANADQIFQSILDFGAGILQATMLSNESNGFLTFSELEAAKEYLEKSGISLDTKLKANLEFLLGHNMDQSLDLSCREQYEKSLALWEQTGDLKSQGCVLYCLGLWWLRYAMSHPIESTDAFKTAKEYWQRCLDAFRQIDAFRQTGDKKLEQKFINAEAEGCKRTKNWEQLKSIAQQAIQLHEADNDPFRLSRAYGFLSEVAFNQDQNWFQAKEFAERAYSLVTNALNNPPDNISQDWLEWTQHYHQGWYLLPLAQAEKALGNVAEAITHLELAKAETKPEYDPELYTSILKELRIIYYQEGKYVEAFIVKQEQREIEQQFGFRAFIGLSPLPAKRIVTNPALLPTKQERIEINAVGSGRQKNVQELIERISLPKYQLIVIHGGSGVGKSSLLRAKLIPALREKTIGPRDVLPIVISDYPDWIENLGNSLKQKFEEVKKIKVTQPFNSTDTIIEQLKKNADYNLLTVLIFDNLEEFWFSCGDRKEIEIFAKFIANCLKVFSVKVILSLREDYLYYLLELNRLEDFGVINNNILDKDILHYLDYFSLDEAKEDIKALTEKTHPLDDLLLEQLIRDLATPSQKIIPVELQMIGAQLENENNPITTLPQYEALREQNRRQNRGQNRNPTEILIYQYLEEITQDCGQGNQEVAEVVLYLLTEHNNIRPRKTYHDLEEGLDLAQLGANVDQLDLVLAILDKAGLVTILSNSEDKEQVTYQLAPDYLTAVIRKRFEIEYPRILINLSRTKAELGQDILIGEIKRLNLTAQQLFAKHDQLNALKEIITAAEKLKSIKNLPLDLQQETENTLKHIIYSLEECNHFEEHDSDVYSLNFSSHKSSFSPDGRLLASGSWDKTIEIWDTKKNELLETLTGHDDAVNSVKISPDGKLLASASADKTIKVWQLVWDCDHEKLTIQDPITLNGHNDWVWDVCFSPDSRLLASAGGDRIIKLWQLNWSEDEKELTIQEFKTFIGHDDKVYTVDYSPGGKSLASGSEDYTIKLWDINTGTCKKTLGKHQGPVKSVRFSHSGYYLASGSEDGTIQLWNLNDSQNKLLYPHNEQVNSVCFRSDDKVLASGGNDNTVKLWSLEGDLLKTFRGHRDWVRYVEFSPNDEILASASDDNTIKLRKLNFVFPKNLIGHTDKIHTICFSSISSNGKTIASGGWDGTIRLWSLGTKNTWKQTQIIHDKDQKNTNKDWINWVWEVSFSPDGEILASGGGDYKIKLWTLNKKLIKILEDHTGTIHSVRFSPNGQYLASGSGDNTVKIWKIFKDKNYNCELVANCKGHKDKVWGVDFSHNNQLIASAGGDRTIKLWNLDGKCIKTYPEVHREWINAVVFSPDGQILASASNDCTIKLWDVNNGKCLKTLEGHNSKVYDVGFSPSGQLLVSASADKTLKIWSIDGTLLKTLEGHRDWVNSAMFSPDGQLIVSASNDKTVKVWDLSNIELKSLSFEELLQRGRDWLQPKGWSPSSQE